MTLLISKNDIYIYYTVLQEELNLLHQKENNGLKEPGRIIKGGISWRAAILLAAGCS